MSSYPQHLYQFENQDCWQFINVNVDLLDYCSDTRNKTWACNNICDAVIFQAQDL